MKIHSDTLTVAQIKENTPDRVYANVVQCGSRKRAHGFTVYLEHLGQKQRGDGRSRRANTPGVAGGLDSPLVGTTTATYDEHGEWMAELFEIDHNAIIAGYNGRDDFYTQTTEVRDRGWRRDARFSWLDSSAVV